MADDDDFSSTLPHVGGFRLRWDVFLSFTGVDTRETITKDLYEALQKRGVRVFLDNDGLDRGDDIGPTLLEAIEDSAAAIIVLSPSYAKSRWCLDELVKICEGSRRLILPLFYQVDPSDVRRQMGPFKDHFKQHEQVFDSATVSRWRTAMNKVGNKAGYVSSSREEAELNPYEERKKEAALIERLVRRVLTEISKTPMGLTPFPVGLHSRVEEVMKLLDIGSKTAQVIVGVHGMGGIGKTTLAQALFNRLVGYFERHSFISNVREISSGHEKGLVTLQSQLIGDLSKKKMAKINQTTAGIAAIKEVVNDKRVLVILDDVDNIEQLNALVGNGQWFYEGSRIIVTSRDRGLLTNHRISKLYEVRELDESQALELFNHHARGMRENRADTFLELSKQIVALTGGLPLALEVFGSSLYDKRTVKLWIGALNKLKQIRPGNLQDVLMLSYDALDDQEKCIFLDIACLFVKMKTKREEAIVILTGCGFDGETVLTVLTGRSLMKITEDTTLWMHDQLRDMGRQIVTQENISHPGRRSRLWDRDEIMNVFKHDKGTSSIEGIVLDFQMKRTVSDPGGDRISWDNFRRSPNCTSALTYLKERYKAHLKSQAEKKGEVKISSKAFGAMVNLRLLQMNYVNLEGNFKFLPAGVKWLQWKGCPLSSLPYDFLPQQLAVLDLSHSKITSLWGGRSSIMACFTCLICSGDDSKVPEKLMFLDLSNCFYLTSSPDLSGNRALQQLNLEHCISLTKLHDSIGNLNTLVHLNLRECKKLVELPSDLSGLKKLEYLILSGCSQFNKLPNMDSLVSLKELLLDDTAIQSLPQSIFRVTKLEKLSLNRCSVLKELPEEIGTLSSLKEISLNGSGLEKLPDSIGTLANLEKLNLFWCRALTTLPTSIGNLSLLRKLATYGTPLTELPVTIGSLSSLDDLSVGHGQFLSSLPDSVGRLSSLLVLKIEETSITDLPQEIGALKTLEELELRRCDRLVSLPESIGRMRALTSIIITAANITELPESIGMLENLTMLQLNRCKQFHKLPASIGQLKSLHDLQMVETAVTVLPDSFGMLTSLMVLRMGKKPQHAGPAQENFILPASFSNLSLLYKLDARACNISGEIADDFERLSSLETLNLSRNSFSRLPASLSGMSVLQELSLPHCRKLKSLPPLPSSLKKVDIANCTALERISDISNLQNLIDLNLTSCAQVMDIPGLECLGSLVRLYLSGCNACSSAVKRRLARKSYLRKIRNLSMPGSNIPDWFSQEMVTFTKQENRPLKSVILCVVVSLNHQTPDDTREELPSVVDIQAQILILDFPTFTTTLILSGVPNTDEDQFHLCRYPIHHPLVSQLKDGYKIHVMRREPPYMKGVELKKWGIYLVYEGDDDYEGDEESLNVSQQSLSEQLANFFSSDEQGDHSV